MRIPATLLAACALLAAPATAAQASYQQPLRLPDGSAAARVPAVRPALRLAQRVWHLWGLTVSSDPVPPLLMVSEGIGDVAGWAWPGDPVIHLHRHLLWLGGPDLCETILHEAGHVAGRGHSTNPRSIMYPSQFVIRGAGWVAADKHHRAVHVVTWIGVDRRCRRVYHARGQS